jgi:DNA-entry nuclease
MAYSRKRKRKNTAKKVITTVIAILILLFGGYFGYNELAGNNNVPDYVDLDSIPAYSGNAYVQLNGGTPFFTEADYTTEAYENYSELDSLGRCGVVMACLGKETMPAKDEDRESISHVYPSGWVQAKYDAALVSGGYLYNRCHLIGWQLSAENDNERNLITGTRYFNAGNSEEQGMLLFENMVADYIKETGNHVMYRVTPVYEGNNLVANGILMEAYSVEDNGEGICFNVYFYNVQPGIEIDYATGESRLAD